MADGQEERQAPVLLPTEAAAQALWNYAGAIYSAAGEILMGGGREYRVIPEERRRYWYGRLEEVVEEMRAEARTSYEELQDQ